MTVELRSTPGTPHAATGTAHHARKGTGAGAGKNNGNRNGTGDGSGPGMTNAFWIILRGHMVSFNGFTLPGSGLQLPAGARLRSAENYNVALAGGDELTLFHSSPGVEHGLVFMVTLAVQSTGGPTFLEGCFRTYDANGAMRILLSSGTEDYFLGTYYFNKGKYATPISGLTHLNTTNTTRFSAYRLHTDDPLVWFGSGGMTEKWRNSDPAGCDLGTTPQSPAVTADSLVFYYEWPSY